MNVGDNAAFRVDALARESETPEAGFLIFLKMTNAIIACGGLFDGRQVGRSNVETGAGAGVLVQGEGTFPRLNGVDRLPKLVTEKGCLGDRVAVHLVDSVGVGQLVVCRAGFFGPAPDFGLDAWVVGYFADLVSLLLAVWKRTRCGEKTGEEEEL